jgi:RimJ/RimL family protein N-acetyltransferase
MTNLNFIKFKKDNHRNLLAEFLASQEWPFHVNSIVTLEKGLSLVDTNTFSSEENETWLFFNSENILVGIIRLFDMDDIADRDGAPLFDIRILKDFQGQGIGKKAVNWLIAYLYESYPKLNKIEATTRADNYSMRKVLKNCLFLKEGHHRSSWPSHDGRLIDTARYAILRNDWINKSVTPLEWNDF